MYDTAELDFAVSMRQQSFMLMRISPRKLHLVNKGLRWVRFMKKGGKKSPYNVPLKARSREAE